MKLTDLFKRNSKTEVVPMPKNVSIVKRKNGLLKSVRSFFAGFIPKQLLEDSDIAYAFVGSFDSFIASELPIIRGKARTLARLNPTARAFVGKVEDNVIGQNGFKLQVELKDSNGNLNSEFSKIVESEWLSWCESATINGKHFNQALRLAQRTEIVEGEVLVRLLKTSKKDSVNEYNFAIQLLSAQWLDHTKNEPYSKATGYFITMGVKKDLFGRVISYFFRTTQGNGNGFAGEVSESEEVPAKEIIHKFYEEEIGQTRGVSWFYCVMDDIKHFKGYTSAVVVSERVAASKMGFLTRKEDSTSMELDEEEDFSVDVTPGSLTTLPQGYEVQSWNPTQSNANFAEVSTTILRQVASGLRISYNNLTGDLTNINYSSIRAGMLAERDYWKVLQADVVISLIKPIFKTWLEQAILSGKITLPGGVSIAQVTKSCKWIGRGWDWVDPLKDIQATLLGVNGGLVSRTDALAEKGDSFEEVCARIAQERELAAEYGLDFTTKTDSKPTAANTDPSQNSSDSQQNQA